MMTMPAALPSPPAAAPVPIAPTLEAWRAMSPAERLRLLVQVNEALSDPRVTMSEGRPHKKAKTRTLDLLGRHFSAMGRVIYLEEEMSVLYPGEEAFSPDVLAVLGVPEPEDDEREAWVVADEGKGLDLAIEVLHHGNRRKDLVENVERYAKLGIPEYFVYDRARQQIRGFRLPTSDARRYQRIVPQAGRFTSSVLGLDLAIVGGTLRFFVGESELGGTPALVGRLQNMVDELNARAEQAAAQAEQAAAVARAGIFALLDVRGVPCPEDLRARMSECNDPATLQRWLLRATTAASAAEILEA
jgi:Uma2 family endonuclease